MLLSIIKRHVAFSFFLPLSLFESAVPYHCRHWRLGPENTIIVEIKPQPFFPWLPLPSMALNHCCRPRNWPEIDRKNSLFISLIWRSFSLLFQPLAQLPLDARTMVRLPNLHITLHGGAMAARHPLLHIVDLRHYLLLDHWLCHHSLPDHHPFTSFPRRKKEERKKKKRKTEKREKEHMPLLFFSLYSLFKLT